MDDRQQAPALSAEEAEASRQRMVDEQIVARGISNHRVIEAMRAVPRHLFVPPEHARHAYEDRPLTIGGGQTISQPYMVAVMTAALDPQPGQRVLEVGTGSGYQAAVLARLVERVVTIERLPELAARARTTLERLGVGNVEVIVGDGSLGAPGEGERFDGILVTAGAPEVPEALVEQLADPGRLVAPIGSEAQQRLRIVRRAGAQRFVEDGEACVFVPLVGRHGWRGAESRA